MVKRAGRGLLRCLIYGDKLTARIGMFAIADDIFDSCRTKDLRRVMVSSKLEESDRLCATNFLRVLLEQNVYSL